MNNYNRTYLGILNATELGSLTNHILDPSFGDAHSSFKGAVHSEMLIKHGIMAIEGGYRSGKTSLITELVNQYHNITAKTNKAMHEKKMRMNNLPTYSIQQILDDDSSSDEEDAVPMTQFPWYKRGY